MFYKDNLLKEVWTKDFYYSQAKQGSGDNSHMAMVTLKKLIKENSRVLDVGCGEGTRLDYLAHNNSKAVGMDISAKAIELAGKRYPKNIHLVGNSEKIPFDSEYFDLVYSAFVFEHLDNPEKVLNEMFRVTRAGGKIALIAPNFGSPNRASPPFKGNRLTKLFFGFIEDFSFPNKLNWNKVTPLVCNNIKYEIDFDTTVEPYLHSLLGYVKKKGLKIIKYSSLWEEELETANFLQKLIRKMGEWNIFPFKYWGPQLLVILEKAK
jgi:ubiquinone/menaquinone biosynthesis C-methylase UbiE